MSNAALLRLNLWSSIFFPFSLFNFKRFKHSDIKNTDMQIAENIIPLLEAVDAIDPIDIMTNTTSNILWFLLNKEWHNNIEAIIAVSLIPKPIVPALCCS